MRQGYIYSRANSGYYVSPDCQGSINSAKNIILNRQKSTIKIIEKTLYDLHPARLEPNSFPTTIWRKYFNTLLLENQQLLTKYSEPQGEYKLRSNIQQYLERSRGVLCHKEQIVITAGLQHSLDIISQLLKNKHNVVAVENPGYHLPRAIFCNHGYKIIPIPVDCNALDLQKLKKSDSTIAYLTPSHQMPLGYVMPVAQRLSVIEWSETGSDKFIIEDDYDSELREILRRV